MSWYNIFPHTLYKQALLMDGKLIDWKVGGGKKTVYDWSVLLSDIDGEMEVITIEIECKNEAEHKEVFEDMTWLDIYKENKKELDIRNKYFRGKKK